MLHTDLNRKMNLQHVIFSQHFSFFRYSTTHNMLTSKHAYDTEMCSDQSTEFLPSSGGSRGLPWEPALCTTNTCYCHRETLLDVNNYVRWYVSAYTLVGEGLLSSPPNDQGQCTPGIAHLNGEDVTLVATAPWIPNDEVRYVPWLTDFSGGSLEIAWEKPADYGGVTISKVRYVVQMKWMTPGKRFPCSSNEASLCFCEASCPCDRTMEQHHCGCKTCSPKESPRQEYQWNGINNEKCEACDCELIKDAGNAACQNSLVGGKFPMDEDMPVSLEGFDQQLLESANWLPGTGLRLVTTAVGPTGREYEDMGWATIYSGSDLSYNQKNLTAAADYRIRVWAVNSAPNLDYRMPTNLDDAIACTKPVSKAECETGCATVMGVFGVAKDPNEAGLPPPHPTGCFVDILKQKCYFHRAAGAHSATQTVCRKMEHSPRTKMTGGMKTWKDAEDMTPSARIPGFSNPTPMFQAFTSSTTRAPEQPSLGCVSFETIIVNLESPPVAAGIFIKKFALERCSWGEGDDCGATDNSEGWKSIYEGPHTKATSTNLQSESKYAFRVAAKYSIGSSTTLNSTAWSELLNVTTLPQPSGDGETKRTVCYSMNERLSTVTSGDLWGLQAPTIDGTEIPPECVSGSLPECCNFHCNCNNNGLNNNDGMACLVRGVENPMRTWPPNISVDSTYDGDTGHSNNQWLYQNNLVREWVIDPSAIKGYADYKVKINVTLFDLECDHDRVDISYGQYNKNSDDAQYLHLFSGGCQRKSGGKDSSVMIFVVSKVQNITITFRSDDSNRHGGFAFEYEFVAKSENPEPSMGLHSCPVGCEEGGRGAIGGRGTCLQDKSQRDGATFSSYESRGTCECQPGRTGEDCSAWAFCSGPEGGLGGTEGPGSLHRLNEACEPSRDDPKENVFVLSSGARDLQGNGNPNPKGYGTGPIIERMSLLPDDSELLLYKGYMKTIYGAPVVVNENNGELMVKGSVGKPFQTFKQAVAALKDDASRIIIVYPGVYQRQDDCGVTIDGKGATGEIDCFNYFSFSLFFHSLFLLLVSLLSSLCSREQNNMMYFLCVPFTYSFQGTTSTVVSTFTEQRGEAPCHQFFQHIQCPLSNAVSLVPDT